ncbi:hypothetical protein Sphch_0506 [Sphingobium chlorophenolicum L-1]|uniref:Uncharacterized protein n=1 Tax=Sphingobium chlorophenolicum L-1 TaxID=690566 RepID=F6EXF5_SPHCR|nr:hypothetical protein [Sphingobium chlorophenolicum]AEG48202.1 hypothetical protein Sphch_0506 [Sphingobium chlorophenolicum L-1]
MIRLMMEHGISKPCLQGMPTESPARLDSAQICSLAKLGHLTRILLRAKNKLESGLNLSVEEVRLLNEALDDLAR